MYLLMEDRLVYDEDKEMIKNAMILLALVMSSSSHRKVQKEMLKVLLKL